MLQRRAVLAALGGVVGAAMLPAGVLASSSATQRKLFSGLVGARFVFKDPSGQTFDARLVQFDDGPRSAGVEQFSVVFDGADLTDGLYDAYHPNTGRMLLSLMSSGDADATVGRRRAYFSNFV